MNTELIDIHAVRAGETSGQYENLQVCEEGLKGGDRILGFHHTNDSTTIMITESTYKTQGDYIRLFKMRNGFFVKCSGISFPKDTVQDIAALFSGAIESISDEL